MKPWLKLLTAFGMISTVASFPAGAQIFRHRIVYQHHAAMVTDINPGPSSAVTLDRGFVQRDYLGLNVGEGRVFQANDGSHGAELWLLLGSKIAMLARLQTPPAHRSSPPLLATAVFEGSSRRNIGHSIDFIGTAEGDSARNRLHQARAFVSRLTLDDVPSAPGSP